MNDKISNIAEDFSIDYLEGVSDSMPLAGATASEQRPDDARILESLETTNEETIIPGITITPQQSDDNMLSSAEETNEVPDFIQTSDVRLSDLISKFLSDSVRPVIIICDDKVQYINQTTCHLLGVSDADILGRNFLDYVHRDDWNLLAENIGVMLTDAKQVAIRLQPVNGQVVETVLEAMYIPDDNHFAFILIGSPIKKEVETKSQIGGALQGLYDALTGLPSFYLFEDRVRVAVNHEAYKDNGSQKNMIAVMAISIDNIFSLQQLGMAEYVLKKIASKLVFSIKKSYTVARGIKCQFWVLMGDLQDVSDLDVELHKIKAILDEGVDDNLTHHDISSSIGVSVFPVVARSGKKLIDQAIVAVKNAQNQGGGINFYSEENQTVN